MSKRPSKTVCFSQESFYSFSSTYCFATASHSSIESKRPVILWRFMSKQPSKKVYISFLKHLLFMESESFCTFSNTYFFVTASHSSMESKRPVILW